MNEEFKEEYVEIIRRKSGDEHANNIERVLSVVSAFEDKFGIPLVCFDRDQMVELLMSWKRIQFNTFQQIRLTISSYMRWLRMSKRIDCSPEMVDDIKFCEISDPNKASALFESNTQIAAAFRTVFFNMIDGCPIHLRQGLCLMLRTIGIGFDEIAVLKRDEIDFENRIIHGAKKDYEDVDQNILSLIKLGIGCSSFYDGNRFQDLMWSDLVVQPIRRKPTELTETSVRGMVQRPSSYIKKTVFAEKSFAPNDLMHSYVFSKLYEYECSTSIRVNSKLSATHDDEYWNYIEKWSGLKLNSYRACKAFVNEYIGWKEFYKKRV